MSETQTIVSPEEMAAKQAEIKAYYESQIPFLEIQKQYETLITELQELEARRAMATMRVAQIMAPMQDQPKEEPKQERTLRKQE
ncbi:hypothetical protein EB118_07120 [bacterium]|nr:hypothetical protein [bacterium]NDD82933.1 hypothetical protein [bacterium]NDG29852.1 hypothetical protein [bacterium]